jgi:hypothetical protein
LLIILKPVVSLYWKSGLISKLTCRSFKFTDISVVTSFSLSMESLCSLMMSFESSRISWSTFPTSLKISSIYFLCWRRKARLLACIWISIGRIVMSLMCFYSSIILFFRAFSKWNAFESRFSGPDSIFYLIITHKFIGCFYIVVSKN